MEIIKCHFCAKEISANSYDFLKVKMHKVLNVSGSSNNQKISFESIEILIPRCSECKKIHNLTIKIRPFGFLNETMNRFMTFEGGGQLLSIGLIVGVTFLISGIMDLISKTIGSDFNTFIPSLAIVIVIAIIFIFLERNEIRIILTNKKTKPTDFVTLHTFKEVIKASLLGYKVGNIHSR